MSNDNQPVEIVIKNAIDLAGTEGHEYVTLEHLVLCLLDDDVISQLCVNESIDSEQIKQDILNYLSDDENSGLVSENGSKGSPKKTKAIERVFQRGLAQVMFNNKNMFSSVDLFISVLTEEECFASYFCQINGLTPELIKSSVTKNVVMEEQSALLSEFTVNLNEEARKELKGCCKLGRGHEYDL